MLSTYLNQLQSELMQLRFRSRSDCAFQLGFVSGLLSAYGRSGAISPTEYDRLQALKKNAWEYACSCDPSNGGA